MCSLLIFPGSCPGVSIGVDKYSFSIKQNQPFYGVKNLTDRYHVVHFQVDGGASRHGYWVDLGQTEKDGVSFVLQYDEATEQFEFVSCERGKWLELLKQYHHLMVSFPTEDSKWDILIQGIDWESVENVLQHSSQNNTKWYYYMDTSLTTKEEHRYLDTKLQRGTTKEEVHLNYTSVAFRSKEAIRESFKMEDFLDKSNYLNQIILKRASFKNNFTKLLSQLQIAFLNAAIFANYGSSLQWHNIIELILKSSTLNEKPFSPSFWRKFDTLLSEQLEQLPIEYADVLINQKMWDDCISTSFHGPSLESTKQKLQQLMILPSFDEEDDEIFTSEAQEQLNYYPNIDSDEDENGPTIAETVTYKRN